MTPPDSDEREVPLSLQQVHLPIRLAQRILAALDKWADYDEGEMHDLASELRERVPK